MNRTLADTHGRVVTALRVSLTDRCNLRCSYCMSAQWQLAMWGKKAAHGSDSVGFAEPVVP